MNPKLDNFKPSALLKKSYDDLIVECKNILEKLEFSQITNGCYEINLIADLEGNLRDLHCILRTDINMSIAAARLTKR